MAISASGAVLGPLLLNPFLHDGVFTMAYFQKHNTTLEDIFHIYQNLSNTGPVTTLDKYHMDLPGVLPENTSQSLNELISAENSLTGSARSTSCSDFSTLIEYPYFITGVIGVPAIILGLYFYIRPGTHCPSNSYETVVDSSTGITNPGNLYFVLMFLFLLCSQGISVAFSSLLTTFGLTSSLNISLSTMSVMTSFFWFIHFIGRMLTVLLPRGTRQLYILCICLVGTLLGTLTLAMTEWLGTAVLCAACALIGLFTGPLVSAGLTWSGQVIAGTPKITSFYVVAISCGFGAQFLCGSVMYAVGPKGFVSFCAESLLRYIKILYWMMSLASCLKHDRDLDLVELLLPLDVRNDKRLVQMPSHQ
ncbi:uncharacterized protein LOC124274197 [Haliotis rubra]|uniref:uncharacterized protein LOC124274197 n=1 Tax=Haliotis rubra TaxID=36100 RepID=UPI001EE586EB|nr:uncharacterized protein LOC124274197 [Haliotis rubra]